MRPLTFITRWFRARLRRAPGLVEIVRSRRARGLEAEYIARRESYARSSLGIFADASGTARSLLARRWAGPRRQVRNAADIRLFVVAAQWPTALPFVPELERSFDVVSLDLAPIVPRLGSPRDLSWRGSLQDRIIESFRAADRGSPVDAALLYVSHYECDPETLQAIARTGCPVLILSMDDLHAFEPRAGAIPNGLRPLIGSASLHLTNSAECLRWYAAEGAAAYLFPEAADPAIYRPLALERDIDVSFVGGWYGGRRRLIERLRAYGIRVKTFGPDTEHGVITREEMVRVFNRTRVNLGYGGVGESVDLGCIKGRDFEVPMTGSVYLTQFQHQLADLYDIGREIVCYRGELDCIEQIRMLLEDRQRSAEIASAGRERAVRDHSWTRRTSDLMRWLGILSP